MDDGTYRFLLRMPPELRDGLRRSAEDSGRSLNGEIVARLVSVVAASVLGTAAAGAAADQLSPMKLRLLEPAPRS